MPNYIPAFETSKADPELAKRYPLNMVSPKPHAFLNTQYANEPVQQRRQGEQTILIHPNDAAARNIESGSYVRVFNDRGSFGGRAELSEDAQPIGYHIEEQGMTYMVETDTGECRPSKA